MKISLPKSLPRPTLIDDRIDPSRVGEKFIQWTDNTPSTEHILTWLSIYWLTKSYPSSIFYYRDPSMRMSIYDRPGANAKDLTKDLQGLYVDKPMGYTKFPCELMPVPESWAKGTGNLVHFNEHQVGESSCLSLPSSRSRHSLLIPG